MYYCLTVTVLFLWGALSDERTGLSVVYAAGPRQSSLSRVRVPWISRTYFTVSVLLLPFPSLPTTCRVTVEVFDLASTRIKRPLFSPINLRHRPTEGTSRSCYSLLRDTTAYAEVRLPSRCLETGCINPLFYCCVRVLRGVYRAVACQCVDISQYKYENIMRLFFCTDMKFGHSR
jgi:hypothetical protein